MAATMNKQQLLLQVHATLKKKYSVPDGPSEPRPILEEVVYAIIREGTPTELADAVYKKFKEAFFDWNEVRVSTIQEVAEVLYGLPEAGSKAKRLIEFLQEHFERTYSFSMEDLEKKGLKQSAKQLSRYKDHGVNDFVVAWVTQRSLGGHAIPLDDPTIRTLNRLGILEEEIEDYEATRGTLEHYIPKSKGIEFTETIIQLATTTCTADQPACPTCPLKADCPTGVEQTTSAAKSKAKAKPGKA
jgi:endonuclease-3